MKTLMEALLYSFIHLFSTVRGQIAKTRGVITKLIGAISSPSPEYLLVPLIHKLSYAAGFLIGELPS